MGRDHNKNRLICAEYRAFFSERYILFCSVRVENKLAGGDVVFCTTSLFVMLCCVCGMRWCRWMVVLGRILFFLRQSTLFLSTSNTFLLISNTLLLVSSFFTKPNLFLSRFFCNFTPILGFFFCLEFFLSAEFLSYIHAMKFLESYPPHITPTEIFVNILFWGGIFVVYLLRKIPPFTAIWRVVAIFLIVLFGTVLWDRFRDKLKDFLK